jgi:hypothetical protein
MIITPCIMPRCLSADRGPRAAGKVLVFTHGDQQGKHVAGFTDDDPGGSKRNG